MKNFFEKAYFASQIAIMAVCVSLLVALPVCIGISFHAHGI